MTGVFTNADGCYLIDLSTALAAAGEREVTIVDELIDFAASYLFEVGILDKKSSLDQIIENGTVWYKDVRLAPSMNIFLFPRNYESHVYLSFPKYISCRIFIRDLHAVSAQNENARILAVPIIIGSVSSRIHDEERNHAHRWTTYVRFPFSIEIVQKLVANIVFELHESFIPCNREISTPGPFELTETGWGEFSIGIVVRFRHGGIFRTSHQLQLFPRQSFSEMSVSENTFESHDGNEPIKNECLKTVEVESNLLTEEMRHAVQEFRESFDQSIEIEQNKRLEGVCHMIKQEVAHERALLSKIQQDQFFGVLAE